MLLVVAIVGGAIFAIFGDQSIQSSSGFVGEDVLVDDFGLSPEGDLQIILRNGGSERVEINSVEIESEEIITSTVGLSTQIGVGDAEGVEVEEFSESGSTNAFDVEINYDVGNLEGLTSTGTITAPYEIVRTSEPVELFEYTNEELENVYDGDVEDFNISTAQSNFGSTSLGRYGFDVSQIINEDIQLEKGDTFRYQQYVEGAWGSMIFGIQDDENYYRTKTRPDEDRIRVSKHIEGEENPIAESEELELERDTWYTHEVEWKEDELVLGVFDETEELITLEAEIDGDYNDYGGAGFRVGAGPVYRDNVRILE